ncbi:hypothetical protein [Inediibacterium massiliense]|uniref:hypothetical protein n=1 Tax=Inediibacterium massiliense TaxID=1658111 RepID=UPI0006B63413|nr:hypothetical protein [Inediibacterium massiliense]
METILFVFIKFVWFFVMAWLIGKVVDIHSRIAGIEERLTKIELILEKLNNMEDRERRES